MVGWPGVVGVPTLSTVCGVGPGAVASPAVAGTGPLPLTPQSPVGGVDVVCGVVGVGCPVVVGVPPLATVCGVEPGAVASPPVAGTGPLPLTPQSPLGDVDVVCGVVGVG